MPTVWIPPPWRSLSGGAESVSLLGLRVDQLVAGLEQRFPGLQARICADGRLKPGLSIVVDGQVAPLGLLQPVHEASEVHFVPALGGG